MSKHAKASSAGSTQGSGRSRGFFRRALATRGASSGAKGSGAPSARALAAALASLLALGALLSLAAAPALAVLRHPYLSQITATPRGPLQSVISIGVSPDGETYVGDEAGFVDKFGPAAEFVPGLGGPSSPFLTGVGLPSSIAVASSGDVYVADGASAVVYKFSSEGMAIPGAGGPGSPFLTGFQSPTSVAVDPSGDVYVADRGEEAVFKFTAEGEPVPGSGGPGSPFLTGLPNPVAVATDAAGNVYVTSAPSAPASVFEYDSTGAPLGQLSVPGSETAVDGSGNVYVSNRDQNAIDEYDPSNTLIVRVTGTPTGAFGAIEPFHQLQGVGLDASGNVYVLDEAGSGSAVDIFGPAVRLPTVTTGTVSDVGGATATVDGTVDPEAIPVTSCLVEYGPTVAYGHTAPCKTLPGNGVTDEPVEADLTGLEQLTSYHYRLAASNASGPEHGEDHTFTTLGHPTVRDPSISDITGESATFEGEVNPDGRATKYRFEYGPSEAYGQSVPLPAGDLAAGVANVAVSAHADTGLSPATTYHYRLTAENAYGSASTPDGTFTTQPLGGKLALPDGRQWELVSPAVKHGANILPLEAGGGVIQAAEDGNAITYLTTAPVTSTPASNPEQTQVLSRRTADGWVSEDISPPHEAPTFVSVGQGQEYRFASPDLTSAIVEPFGPFTPLSPEATERTPYLRDNTTGTYVPLVTAADVAPGTKFGGDPEHLVGDAQAIDATPDLSHVILSSTVALTSTPVEAALYEWTAGRLQLVSILPEDEEGTAVQAELAFHLIRSTPLGLAPRDRSEALSSDGSRVIWLAGKGIFASHIYMRDITKGTGGESIRLDPGLTAGEPQFLGASSDGSKVYFTEGDLYEFALDAGSGPLAGTLTDLTAQGRDMPSSGRYRAFMSSASLTGYDNTDARSGERDEEVYLYDTSTEHLVCASCNPTGARPIGVHDTSEHNTPALLVDEPFEWNGTWLAGSIPGGTRMRDKVYNHTSHYLDPATGRLFFNSPDALVPQATNGVENVYEYEPVGVGSCSLASVTFSDRSDGCVSLISSGTSVGESAFLDASADGNDVFFMTTGRLAKQDVDTSYDVYDAHVCNQSTPCLTSPVSPPPCDTSDSCRPAATLQPPIFGSPPSATFSGAGNVKSLTRAQKLARALRKCRKQRDRGRRRVCERRVHMQYRAKQSRDKGANKGGHR